MTYCRNCLPHYGPQVPQSAPCCTIRKAGGGARGKVDQAESGVQRPTTRSFDDSTEEVSQLSKRTHWPFLYLPFYARAPDWVMPPIPRRTGLYSVTASNAIPSRETLEATPTNKVLPALRASLGPVTLTYKISHHRHQMCSFNHHITLNHITSSIIFGNSSGNFFELIKQVFKYRSNSVMI